MFRRLTRRRSAGAAPTTPERTSRTVFLIDYLTWHARLAGSTRSVSAAGESTPRTTRAA